MSKHDDRRRVEAGPSLSTVVSRADADKLGSSERLDLVSVGAAGKIQIVRVTQAMYDTIPADGSSMWIRGYQTTMVDGATNLIYVIGTLTIPVNLVLDISSICFTGYYIPMVGPQFPQLFPDYHLNFYKYFNVDIDGVNPIDIADRWAGAAPAFTGNSILNQRWNRWLGDIPFHVIANQNQVVRFTYFDNLATGIGPTCYIRAEVAGRWISKTLFDEAVAANRIS